MEYYYDSLDRQFESGDIKDKGEGWAFQVLVSGKLS
jgi:hypothetical protein